MTAPVSLKVHVPEVITAHAQKIDPIAAAGPGGKTSAVMKWNDVLIDTVRKNTSNRGGPTWASRNMAMVQIAVYDALNAIDGSSAPYALRERASSKHASKSAAVAVAAHDTLVHVYPEQKAALDAELVSALAQIQDGPHKLSGMRIGKASAEAMVLKRGHDGAVVDPVFTPVNKPGHWQPDPMHPTQTAIGATWGDVLPFAMGNRKDFQIAPPPALDSPEYAAAYKQVKSLGAMNSRTRTADETEAGNFWAYDRAGMGPPMVLFNMMTRQIAEQRKLPLDEQAKVLALVNMAMADAGIAAWGSKYDYDLWRPITGIRDGKADHNSDTWRDKSWAPLGAPASNVVQNFTPAFPSYPSGHAVFGGAAFGMLKNYFGTDGSEHGGFNLTSDEIPGKSRHFKSFADAASENAMSRVYLGVHWLFDSTRGVPMGEKIANRVWETQMQPQGREGDGFTQAQKKSGPVI